MKCGTFMIFRLKTQDNVLLSIFIHSVVYTLLNSICSILALNILILAYLYTNFTFSRSCDFVAHHKSGFMDYTGLMDQ